MTDAVTAFDVLVTVFLIAALFVLAGVWDWLTQRRNQPRKARRATFAELIDLDRETPRERQRREAVEAADELRGWAR